MTDSEGGGVARRTSQKGGFVIVDDFKAEGDFGSAGWEPFADNMRRVMPEGRFVDMDTSHPIFHSFFEIHTLANFPQAYNAGAPVFRGLFEDNDPTKRLQMIVNYNTDISQYWEWSGRGLRPFDETNEAYKLGVNYIIYGMMHYVHRHEKSVTCSIAGRFRPAPGLLIAPRDSSKEPDEMKIEQLADAKPSRPSGRPARRWHSGAATRRPTRGHDAGGRQQRGVRHHADRNSRAISVADGFLPQRHP